MQWTSVVFAWLHFFCVTRTVAELISFFGKLSLQILVELSILLFYGKEVTLMPKLLILLKIVILEWACDPNRPIKALFKH